MGVARLSWHGLLIRKWWCAPPCRGWFHGVACAERGKRGTAKREKATPVHRYTLDDEEQKGGPKPALAALKRVRGRLWGKGAFQKRARVLTHSHDYGAARRRKRARDGEGSKNSAEWNNNIKMDGARAGAIPARSFEVYGFQSTCRAPWIPWWSKIVAIVGIVVTATTQLFAVAVSRALAPWTKWIGSRLVFDGSPLVDSVLWAAEWKNFFVVFPASSVL